MKKKRLLGILLSITLILGLTPGVCMTVHATTEYDIWIAGVQVTSENMNNVLPGTVNDGKVSFTPSSGSDPAILALSGASITCDSSDAAIYYDDDATDNLTIELSGTNTVISNNNNGDGIKSKNKDITITGSGTLNVFGENGIDSLGSVTISGVTVDATGSDAGIYASDAVTIKDSSTVKARGTDNSSSYGIIGESIYINDSIVNATGCVHGLHIFGLENIEINGGEVTATATGGGNSCGIKTFASNIIINGGTVTATGNRSGIYSETGSVAVRGGEVKANIEGDDGIGIHTNQGDVTIEGGTVEAICTGAGSRGIFSNNIEISGGIITASGKASGIYSHSLDGNIVLSGGKTTATANGTDGYGIQSNLGDVTISGDNTVVVATGTGDGSYGIHAKQNIAINGGNVTASGRCYGLYAFYSDITISGGTVTTNVTGDNSKGIYSPRTLTISGGEVEVTASGNNSRGIESTDTLTISGGEVTAKATGTGSSGTYSRKATTISGGKVTATGDMYGIYSHTDSITISGDNTVVDAKGTGETSYGIYAFIKSIYINDSNVTASGRLSGIESSEDVIRISGSNPIVKATGYEGIQGKKGIEISGGNITAYGRDYGIISVSGTVTISHSKVTATNSALAGIYANGNTIIEDSEVNAGASGYDSKGISSGEITISGSTVNASGNHGIFSDNTITINSGTVDAYANGNLAVAIYNNGSDSDIIINGGNVNATATGGTSYGIHTYGVVTISDGNITASGDTKAINTKVKNSMVGTGWANSAGTGDAEIIDVDTGSGQTFTYKKVQFPCPTATITTEPEAKNLTYNGQEQSLVTEGVAEHGTMQYALGENTTTAPSTGWDTSIPKRTDAGTYYVWYRAEGDTGYVSTTPACITVTIKNKPFPTPVRPTAVVTKAPEVTSLIYNGQPQELVAKGEAIGGTMEYAIGTDGTTAPTDGWSKEIPTGTDAGTYHIWYRVVGDKKHKDVDLLYAGATKIEGKHSDNVISIDEEKGIATVKDEVTGGTSEVPIEVITEGPIYRMYDPNRGEHLFTKKWADVEVLLEWGWIHESDSDFTVVNATDEDAMPVYRLYNPNFGGMHYYTDNAEDAKYLASVGWNYEGISHYVYKASSTKGTPQYKLYNPNSPSGEHIWLSDESGINMLIDAGWIYEGICWRIA